MFGKLMVYILAFIIVFTKLGRFLALHLVYILFYLPVDIYRYFKFKKYNECPNYGYIKIFNGYWGNGKTLSEIDEIVKIYRKYNGLPVWSKELKTFVSQKITIVSNVDLVGIPYIPYENERQFIEYEHSPGEVVLYVWDEIGALYDNRNFRSFNPEVLQKMVQSRKRKIAIYGTVPKLSQIDKKIRDFTDDVIICTKFWRILKHRYYKADELEFCPNVDMLTPHRIEYIFVNDRMYNQYDTNSMVEQLKRDMMGGKMVTFEEKEVESVSGTSFVSNRLKKKFRKS